MSACLTLPEQRFSLMPITSAPNSANGKSETPFVFTAYGLSLHANVGIPGLFDQPARLPADVRIWLGETHPELDQLVETQQQWYLSPEVDDTGTPGLTIWKLADGGYFRLVYFDGTEFVFDESGTQIWVTWSDKGTLAYAASYLLGPILGLVLRLRGVTCLHSSCISIDGQAIAFVGPGRAGKSTTAAAFAGRGYPVIADDIIALAHVDGTFFAQSGCPRLRLWPTSVEALARIGSPLPHSLPPDWGHRRYYLDLTQNGYEFERRVLPLAAIYLLSERSSDPSAPYVEAMTGGESLMGLIANTYGTKLLDASRRADEFTQLKALVDGVPVRRVYAHEAPEHLGKLCDLILSDFQQLRNGSPSLAGV